MNISKQFYTRDYILNQDVFNKDCLLRSQSEKIYAVNSPYELPLYPKCWDESKIINNSLVLQNIKNGGNIYYNNLRSNINSKIGSRLFNQYVRSPCDYVKDVETEFYLLHGESKSCSGKEWKYRHK